MLQGFVDIDSLRWATLELGAAPEGIRADVAVRLKDGNDSLAYHLLRTPALGGEALKAVPQGVAGFLAFALSKPGERAAHPAEGGAEGTREPLPELDFA